MTPTRISRRAPARAGNPFGQAATDADDASVRTAEGHATKAVVCVEVAQAVVMAIAVLDLGLLQLLFRGCLDIAWPCRPEGTALR